MRRVAIAPFLILVLMLSGRSGDAAEELKWESPGPWGGFIFRVQVDEEDADRVLAFTTRGNFFSPDAGESWRLVRQSHHPFPGSAMNLSYGMLWLVDEGVLVCHPGGNGPWLPRAKLPGLLLGLARVPGKPPRYIWVSTRKEGPKRTSVFVLSPGRNIARKLGEIPAEDLRLDHRDTLVSHPAAPAKLRLIVSMYDRGETWIYGSEDAGESWESWSAPLHLNAIAPVPGKSDEWLGAASPLDGKPSGVVRSVDGGRTWAEFGDDPRLRGIRTLLFHPVTGALLLGSYTEGVLESPDLGKALHPRGKGLGIDNVCALAADPRRKDRLYAGTQAGLYRSDDGGQSWKWSSKGMAALQTTDIRVLPGDRVLLLEYQQGVRVSEDGGRTWPPFVPGWKERHGKAFGAHVFGELVLVNTGGASADAVLSRDAGRSWMRCEISRNEWILGVTGPKSFFATDRHGSILRSRDGIRYEKLCDRPPDLDGYPERLLRLAGNRVVILSRTGSVAFDPETGKSGGAAALPGENDPKLAVVDPIDAAVLWIGTLDGGLHRRRFPDGKWDRVVERGGRNFVGLIADPGREGRRIACFFDGPLLVSEDGGARWKPLEDRQRFRTAKAVAVTSDRRLLLVADGSVRVLDLESLDD